jgi:sirohydrochlorin cobaltochelatase
MFTPKPNAAIVIIGHGSTLNPDSSTPTFQHADEIRSRGLFAEVACCFWKEEPSMREVYAMLDSREVYLVPNFISEGYFCQEVLPRELRVTGPITETEGKVLYYCDPVGIHPNMTKLLLQRADEVAPGVPRGETSLIIVGHGTSLNENSRKVIEQQVALIRDGGYGFAEVVDAYMEEKPLVNDCHTLTTSPNVVVVPFFIADGLHSYQDIPVLLGMEAEGGAAASQREVFRHISLLEDVAAIAVRGMLAAGYERAVALIAELRAEATK